jgi:hypothetical protein
MNRIKFDPFDIALATLLIGNALQISVNLMYTFLGYGYPYNTHLFRPADRFGDLINFLKQCGNYKKIYMNPIAESLPSNYLPETYIAGNLYLNIIPTQMHIAFFVIAALLLVFLSSIMLNKAGSKPLYRVIIFLFASYPMQFSFDRLNIELLMCPLFTFFILRFNSWRSAITCSVMACLKIYPLALILLYLREKRWLEIVATVAIVSLLTLAAYANFDGSIIDNIKNNITGIQSYARMYSNTSEGHIFSSSLSNVFYIFNLYTYRWIIYFIIASYTLYKLFFAEISEFNAMFMLLSAITIMQDILPDYKLLAYLIAATALLLKLKNTKLNFFIAVLLGVILSPQSYLHILPNIEMTIGIIVRPLLVLLLFLIIAQQKSLEKLESNEP